MTATDFNKRMRDDEEIEAYAGLVASDSQESDSEECQDNKETRQRRNEEMRKKLLGDDSDSDRDIAKGELLDVNFGIGFGEDIGEKLMEDKEIKD